MDDLAKILYQAYVSAKLDQYRATGGVELSNHIDTLNPWESLSRDERDAWDATVAEFMEKADLHG